MDNRENWVNYTHIFRKCQKNLQKTSYDLNLNSFEKIISTDCSILSLMEDHTIAIRVFDDRPKTYDGFTERRMDLNA